MSLVEVHEIHKTFPARQRGGDPVHAIRGVSLTIDEGETLAIIGESGAKHTRRLASSGRVEEPR